MADRTRNPYAACDRVIKEMDRWCLREFGKLKLAKFDELNVVRDVNDVYRRSAREARRKYYEEAFEVYVMICLWCGVDTKEAHRMAEKAISLEWVDAKLEETDAVTKYRFTPEMERKAARLVEALAVGSVVGEIDKALRLWSKQLGQYAINFTDYAALEAFADAGVSEVEWVSQKDDRVCTECHELDGQVFPVDEVPDKPHYGCRCFWRAVLNGGSRLK